MQSYERASRSFRQSLRLKSRIGVKATSGSLIGLAVAEENLGHTSAAVRVYRQALRVARSQGNRDHVVRIYNNLGEIYQNRGEYGDAVKVYSKAITLAQKLGARDLGVLCRANRALALAELSKRGRREEGISEIKQLATKSGLPHLMWVAHAADARALERDGRLSEAMRAYERAIEAIEGARTQRPTRGGRAHYLESKLTVYEQYIALLLRWQEEEPKSEYASLALTVAERAKARTVLESLPTLREKSELDFPRKIRQKQDALLSRISSLQGQILKLSRTSPEREERVPEQDRREAHRP